MNDRIIRKDAVSPCPDTTFQNEARMWWNGEGQMKPPWQAYPTYSRYSLGWRMGVGEDYWVQFWDWFSCALSDEQRAAFIADYPEPDGWEGCYQRMLADRTNSQAVQHPR